MSEPGESGGGGGWLGQQLADSLLQLGAERGGTADRRLSALGYSSGAPLLLHHKVGRGAATVGFAPSNQRCALPGCLLRVGGKHISCGWER